MSYRVDIPTLSTNEVYTLTFEYEGTETIQLIVGDLTLETTDRRVVFTTTSPVYYIESNVNLTNLNIYEGYYESDDFGGEYTQESYIEGKSLINLMPASSPKTLSKGWSLDFDETTGLITITFTDNTNNFDCTARAYGLMEYLKPSTDYTFVIDILENSLVDADGNASTKPIFFFNTSAYLYPDTHQPFNRHAFKGDITNSNTPIIEGSVGRYLCGARTVDTFLDTMSADMVLYAVAYNGTLKAKIMVLEGDYTESGIETNWFPQGIGCVKSPKIVSHKAKNLVPAFKITSGYGSNVKIEVFDDNKHIEFAHTGDDARLQFQFDVTSIGLTSGDLLGIEFDAITKGVGTVANRTSAHLMFFNARNTDDNKTNYFETGHYKNVIEITSNPIQIHFRQNVRGANGNEYFIVKNFSVFKINSVDDMKDNYEECVVSTPDDLELYKVNDRIYDKLDLTTGTLYKNTGTYVLDETFVDRTSNWNTSVNDTTGNVIFTSRQYKYLREEHNFPGGLYNNAIVSNADPAKNIVNNSNIVITRPRLYFDIYSNNNYTVIIMPASYNVTTLEELRTWLQNNPMIFNYKLGTPYTEQLDINVLKSYRNGSIQTSSQQLAPTLKTTLPISNKFTTTNLTSGSTYNVYFDGTATKLDAGGTIITNPVSPCEVECGGTTLTIEGTDIQNVRVLETTNKNEVGNVNETTDVVLSKITTSEYENMVYDNVWTLNKKAGGASVVIDNDNKTIFSKGSGSWAYTETKIGTFPKGVSLVHIECDIEMKSKQRAYIKFGNDVSTAQYNFRDLKLNNDTATICQGNSSGVGLTFASFVTKGHFSNLLYVTPSTTEKPINLFILTSSSMDGLVCNATNCAEGSIDGYTVCGADGATISNIKIRVVENYPDDTTFTQHPSLIRQGTGQVIWQDMNLSFGHTISKLEQPIKLRSLGTTYDSYNPITGELIKRIGVSETDGSYSVLSSPIVMETRKTEVNGYMADRNTICKEYSKGYEFNTSGQLSAIDIGHYTDYYIEIPENTKTLSFKGMSYYKRIMIYDENKKFIKCFYTYDNYGDATGNITSDMKYVRLTTVNQGSQGRGYGDMRSYLVTDTNYLVFTSDTSLQTLTVPQLYTNGQVKVYSDSEVYPTTILNGQSTNNYEINELNKSNNYTIRYEGECESINLNSKSNEQGTNRIVKTSTNGSGNLTFVNDSGDINNVLLVQNDVREQEINHFNGLQTVEVNRMLIENQKNMWWNDWIAPSEYGASWQVESPEFIPVQPGETIYVVADNNSYTSLFEFDENYNIVNQGKDLILSNEANPKPINLGNNYYKNYKILSENTRYIKFTIPVGTATTAKNETRWSVISFTRADIGNVPLYTNNTPYRGSIINLPQPVQLNSLPDGTHDTYNPITGEYVQNVGRYDVAPSNYEILNFFNREKAVELWLTVPNLNRGGSGSLISNNFYYDWYIRSRCNPFAFRILNDTKIDFGLPLECCTRERINEWFENNPTYIYYSINPIVTQLTPINIPTFEGGIVQLITTDGKVFPMIEYSMPTNNRYDTSSWETGAVYTQRNMTEAYFNESTTPMIPTETMTLTTDHISSGSIILNDNGNGLIVLKGNYTGRDIPYFTGMRSVEAIEVETTPSSDQPLFGKGGRK